MLSFSSPLIAVLFSTPVAAAAVAGGVAAVPIIIHLLNRRRYLTVNWAAMRFLLAAQRKNVRRLKLEQWLLLACRILIGLLIVAAMASVMPWAEPMWQRLIPGETTAAVSQGRTHRIIVVDGSFTMGTRRGDDSTRFDLAKSQAFELLRRSSAGDGYSVVFLASPAQVIVPGPADDREKVRREIDDLKLPHGSADLAGGLRLVADMVNRPLGKYSRREVTFITDVKKSTWTLPSEGEQTRPVPGDLGAAAGTGAGIADSWQSIAKGANLVFVDVAQQDLDNLAVANLTLGDPLPLVGVNTSVSAIVQNHGKSARLQVPVELRIGQAPKPGEKLVLKEAGQKLVNVAAGTSVTVNFALENQYCFHEPGDYVLQVRAGEDSLRLDDVRSLAVTVRGTIPVLVVNGKYSPEPLDTPGVIVAEALNPSISPKRIPVKRDLALAKIKSSSPAAPDLINPVQFEDGFRADLAKYDCLFLCDLPFAAAGSESERREEMLRQRLDAHLRRGGSIFISLGPNAAQNLEACNRVYYNDGKGILPGRVLGVKRALGDGYFTLFADEEAFKRRPLLAFREDDARAALSMPQFHQYVRLAAPANGAAQRVLSFLPVDAAGKSTVPGETSNLDPAVVDYPRLRGHVIVYTSTFNPERLGKDQFWSNWATQPTFLPFIHEALRYAVASGSHRDLLAGEVIEDYLSVSQAGMKARLSRVEADREVEVDTGEVQSRDGAAIVRFSSTELSGIYRVAVGSGPESLFAANVPTTAPSGGNESDLHRLSPPDLRATAPEADIQYVNDASEVQQRSVASTGNNPASEKPTPRGPAVARVFLLIVLGLMFLEVLLAWYYGSSRATETNTPASPPKRNRIAAFVLWSIPAGACFVVLASLAHAFITGDFLGFLPGSWRHSIEQSLGVPAPEAGEGTRWRLKAMAYLTEEAAVDRWLVGGLIAAAFGWVWLIYRRERLGYEVKPPNRYLKDVRVPPALLRVFLLGLTMIVLLPQMGLVFEREGWPDIVLVFDDSRSMSTVEPFHDPLLRDKTDELKKTWSELAKPRIEKIEKRIAEIQASLRSQPSQKLREELAALEKKRQDLRTPHRLNLIKALLASGSRDWLQTLLRERQMRVHLYRASVQATRIAELSDPAQCEQMLEEIIDIIPDGESSRLGDAVNTILKSFRGGSLNAVVMFTDGNTPKDEDLPEAARLAARMGVPLYFVGVGENQPPPDISIGDLMAERSMNVKDNLIMRFQLKSQGPGMPSAVPVLLYEVVDGKQVLRSDPDARYSVNQQVRLSVTPDKPGDKKYVIEVPVQKGEVDPKNNRLVHEVHVEELKRVRVLLIEGAPRYEFRYIKTFFERESDKVVGNKSIELNVLLLSANREFAREDASAIPDFPNWELLKAYDVIILGDVDPKQFPREQTQVKMLADFVRERGGGLLMIAGDHFSPAAYAGTELGDILPVTTETIASVPAPKSDDPPIRTSYSPKLTSIGMNHPIFRFVADDAENAALWSRLAPLYWYAKGYRRKPTAEVLAVHPERLAEPGKGAEKDELHPLALQQFVGDGRVMFFGFDETWRWRLRQDERRFNQFWVQTIRSLARGKVGRIEIDVGRSTFRRDEPIRITVRFPEDARIPPASEHIKVQVERRPLKSRGNDKADDEPETETVELNAKEGTRATFEALLTHTPEGEYRFTLVSPPTTGLKPKTEAVVLPPKGEMDDVQLKEGNLELAASRSRGQYYPLNKADQLLDNLPNGLRVALDQPIEPLTLWNHWLMFALAFSLLLAEWVLRKRVRLL